MALLLHLERVPEDALQEVAPEVSGLLRHLSIQGVPAAVLVECASALEAARAMARLQAAGVPAPALTVALPAQLEAAVRLLSADLGGARHLLLMTLGAGAGSGSATFPAAATSAAEGIGCAHEWLPLAQAPRLGVVALQQLARALARASGSLLVGRAMKASRAEALAAAGLLPLVPVNGVTFMPLDLSPGAGERGELLGVGAVLHKLTDSVGPAAAPGAPPALGAEAVELERLLSGAPGVCVVDPLQRVAPLADRAALAGLLGACCADAGRRGLAVRTPAWALLSGGGGGAWQALQEAGLSLPCLIKPQVACGVAVAHRMAVVVSPGAFHEGVPLGVALPAVAQEYVDHGGVLWKCYVAGDRVFVTQHRSLPDLRGAAQRLAAGQLGGDFPASFEFDSLRELPASLPWLEAVGAAAAGVPLPQVLPPTAALEEIAHDLRKALGLTLFGFDAIRDSRTGCLVLVDANYFPSFRGLPDAPAAVAAAILAAKQAHDAELLESGQT